MLEGVILVITAIIAGILGGLLGIGGGVIIMPVLSFFCGVPIAYAAGTTAVAVFCTTVSGGYKHVALGHVDIPSLTPVLMAGALSTAVFSWIFVLMEQKSEWLTLGIGCVFLVIALRMIGEGIWGKKDPSGENSASLKAGHRAKILVGAISGILPGLFGIGTGAVLVPAFHYCLKRPMKIAIGSSLVCFAINALISSVFKFFQGFVLLDKAMVLCVGTIVGAYIGAVWNNGSSSRFLKLLFGIVFLYVSSKYIFLFLGIRI